MKAMPSEWKCKARIAQARIYRTHGKQILIEEAPLFLVDKNNGCHSRVSNPRIPDLIRLGLGCVRKTRTEALNSVHG